MASNKLEVSRASATANAKLGEVSSLIEKLWRDLSVNQLGPNERTAALERLKVLGRNVEQADPIFTRRGIETLARHGFDQDVFTTAAREALRCLANSLLLQPSTRRLLLDLGYLTKASTRLKDADTETEFLLSRILFLLTYESGIDFQTLIEDYGLADGVTRCLKGHCERYRNNSRHTVSTTSLDDMALSETLKLLFNITHFHPPARELFLDSIAPIIMILSHIDLVHPPLQPPINHLINSLLNMDLDSVETQELSRDVIFPDASRTLTVKRLIEILGNVVVELSDHEIDQAAPLLLLIRKTYAFAPEEAKEYMQSRLLPPDSDRSKPLGKSNSLSSRLLNLSSSALDPMLRESVLALMYELSDKDANKFVDNVGYGFAAGFLMNNQIPVPKHATMSQSERSDSSSANGRRFPVNPITGQKLDAETDDISPAMTEEEKEREAEKLFVLFERLKKTGVVNIKNPVEQAIDEGRFEELD